MRSGAIPFRFEITEVIRTLAQCADARKPTVQLSVPYMTVLVSPRSVERAMAAEIIVKSMDRRVLSAQECCDGCIRDALRSLQEFRAELLSQKTQLASTPDSSLAQILELMLVAIRQFLTFEQRISRERVENVRPNSSVDVGRQAYFDALELLRGHLSRCLGQVAMIACLRLPSDGLIGGYQGPWPLDAYAKPNLLMVRT